MIRGGFPEPKIAIKPNFVPDGVKRGEPVSPPSRFDALFVGRLAPEKGLDLLLDAWSRMSGSMRLAVVGEGILPRACPDNVEFLGKRAPAEVYSLMGHAGVVVMPGKWPEPFGRVAVEAFAQGTPVVCSDIGGLSSIVQHGRNGLIYTPGDSNALAAALTTILGDKHLRDQLGAGARADYEAYYTPEANLAQLERIYAEAMEIARTG